MESQHIYYELTKMSYYSKNIEQGDLVNNQIISNTFYIPYKYCQGAYCDNDVCFLVKLFHNNMKIFEYEIQFELFDDSGNEEALKKIKWKPSYTHEKYIQHYFENIECKDCYIQEENLIIIFDIDLTINGCNYEQIYGLGSYDWNEDKIKIFPY